MVNTGRYVGAGGQAADAPLSNRVTGVDSGMVDANVQVQQCDS